MPISGANNLIGVNALLGELVDNGGPTLTHELQPGSPAIDAGDTTLIAGTQGTPAFDQRGAPFSRIEVTIDLGAFESASTGPGGDFNDDGVFDTLDIDSLIAEIAAGSNNPAFDLNDDGSVDLLDRDLWLELAGEANLGPGRTYLLADANLDGTVDGQDFLAWNTNKFSAVPAWSAGDWNGDGTVDGQDFLLWNTFKFQSADGRSSSGRQTDLATSAGEHHDTDDSELNYLERIFAQWAE